MKLLLAYIFRFFYNVDKRTRLRQKCPLKKSRLWVIGSVRIGGAGKTPITLELANFLQKNNFSVAVLLHNSAQDEAKLFKKKNKALDIFLTNNRAKTALKLDGKYEYILCDDGFEDKRLLPDKKIFLDFGENANSIKDLFPQGNCRSFKKDHNDITNTWTCFGKNPDCKFSIEKIIAAKDYFENTQNASNAHLQNATIACAIGDPKRFEQDIKNCGIQIAQKYFFLDHSKNFEQKIEKILHQNTPVIITEKDAMRIQTHKQNKNLFIACQKTELNANIFKTLFTER